MGSSGSAQAGQANRDRMAAKSRDERSAVADIGDIPPIKDPERREACRLDPELFAQTYFGHVPYGVFMPLEAMHREILADFDEIAQFGGCVSRAAPRGGGKTTLCLISLIRGQVYGFVRSDVYLCETVDLAAERLALIKMIYRTNDLLAEDFPEVCYPVRALEGKPQRQLSQNCNGELTDIRWTADHIVLPKIRNPKTRELWPSSGCRLTIGGMQTGVRGLLDEVGRPDRVVIDDPQGDDAAMSPTVRMKRRKLIGKALGQLGSQYSNLAMIMLCTIIEPDDIADEFTDRTKRPEWDGKRYKFLATMPDRTDLWDKYMAMRREDQEGDDRYARRAHRFYLDHKAVMDAGAVMTLPNAYAGRHVVIPPATETRNVLPDGSEIEASAIQSAYNVIATKDGEDVFACEYQNEPIVEEAHDNDVSAEELAGRLNGYGAGTVPLSTDQITIFVDVQKKVLYWLAVAWEAGFSGNVLDYGTWPKQAKRNFTPRSITRTLARAKPGAGLEGQIYNGLEKLTDELLGRPWRRVDGAELRVSRCLIDANWGQSTDVVYQFCRQSRHAAVLTPSHGKYYGAKSREFADQKRVRGERVGLHWRMPNPRGRRPVRYAVIDTNFWKTFVSARLKVAIGDPGALLIYGPRAKPTRAHALLFEHLTAERCTQVEAHDRVVDEWDMKPGRTENHWWDCLVGAAVAASMAGVVLGGGVHQSTEKPRRRKRVSLADANRRNRR